MMYVQQADPPIRVHMLATCSEEVAERRKSQFWRIKRIPGSRLAGPWASRMIGAADDAEHMGGERRLSAASYKIDIAINLTRAKATL
jgi:hypothetical protein